MAAKFYLSHLTVWLLTALPAMLALMVMAPTDFSAGAAVLNMLGRLSGIWGLSCLLVAAMLSCRLPGFDQPFGGLTKLWQLHHMVGVTGFILLLVHPLLLAFSTAAVSTTAAVASLFSSRLAVLCGWVALLALMVVMVPTFQMFGKPDYQRWKKWHRLTGITLVFGLSHTLLLGRTLPAHWSVVLWVALGLLAVSAMVYRWLISHYVARLAYRTSKVSRLSATVVELSLQPLANHLQYRPGQFVYLRPDAPELSAGNNEEHPYTISSAPSEPILRVSIKALGDASQALQNIAVGSCVTVEGPYGNFFPLNRVSGRSLWIAGGIGIVPFLSYLRQSASQHAALDVQLIYCVEDEAQLLFADELSQLAATIDGFRLTCHLFCRDGPLDSRFIGHHCPDVSARKVWICGPAPLLWRSRTILRSAGVSAGDIITEEFNLLQRRPGACDMKQLSFAAFIGFWSVVATLFVLSLLAPAPRSAEPAERTYTLQDIARHNSIDDCWMAIAGQVYDFSQFIPKHPAPVTTMAAWCGKEATQGMTTKGYGNDHSPAAWAMAEAYRIGTLSAE